MKQIKVGFAFDSESRIYLILKNVRRNPDLNQKFY